ncbi:MAG: HK97 family phage prohead protease [Anaplasma sp.]
MNIIKRSSRKKLGQGSFQGYASVFNHVDGQNDTIEPGAFADSLKQRRIVLLWQHSIREPIGKVLRAREDSFGLLILAKLNLEIQRAREAYALMKDGSIDALSIGYKVVKSRREGRSGVRVISRVDLWEISIVSFPANNMARIGRVEKGIPR